MCCSNTSWQYHHLSLSSKLSPMCGSSSSWFSDNIQHFHEKWFGCFSVNLGKAGQADGHGEDDGWVVLCWDWVQCLQVPQLNKIADHPIKYEPSAYLQCMWRLMDDLCCFFQCSGSLLLALSSDNLHSINIIARSVEMMDPVLCWDKKDRLAQPGLASPDQFYTPL